MTPNMSLDVAAVVLLTDMIAAMLAFLAWGGVVQLKKKKRPTLVWIFWVGMMGVIAFVGTRLHFF